MKKKIFYECRIIYFLRLTCASTPEALNHEYHLIRKAAWLAVFQIFYIFLYFENLRFPFGIWDMAFLLNCL